MDELESVVAGKEDREWVRWDEMVGWRQTLLVRFGREEGTSAVLAVLSRSRGKGVKEMIERKNRACEQTSLRFSESTCDV